MRTELLFGSEGMEKLKNAKVALLSLIHISEPTRRS